MCRKIGLKCRDELNLESKFCTIVCENGLVLGKLKIRISIYVTNYQNLKTAELAKPLNLPLKPPESVV